jgi:DNA-binding beta-propeller fold protein YncE
MILAILLALAAPSHPIAVSVGDGKQVLDDGNQVVPAHPAPDRLSLIDLSGAPRIVSEILVPASVIGPPGSVAITPDGRFAIVTCARIVDPADPTKIIPDDRVSLVDLQARPLRLVATLRAGAGASGVAIDPSGRHVLVANRAEGSVSLFILAGGTLRLAQTLRIGDAASSPAQPVFFAKGRRALVSRDGDHQLSTLRIDGDRMTLEPGSTRGGLRPYGLSAAPGAPHVAVVANIGGGGHDIDTISLIDLDRPSPRVVDTVAVGLTPEGVAVSPDGRFAAINLQAGSASPAASPEFRPNGEVQIWRIDGGRLVRVTRTDVGRWGQGIGWTADGRTLIVQSNVEHRIDLFRFDGRRLVKSGSVTTASPPAALAVGGR